MKRHTSFPRENQSAARTKRTQPLSVLAAVAVVTTSVACGEEVRIQPEVSSKPAPQIQGRFLSDTDATFRAKDFAKNANSFVDAAQAERWVQQYNSAADRHENDEVLRKVSEEILRSLAEQRPIRILVTWDDQDLRRIEQEMGLDDENITIKGTSQVDTEKLATRIELRRQFYTTYGQAFAQNIWGKDGISLTGSQIVHQYENFPIVAVTLTSPDALQKIAASHIVRLIGEETFAESSLASSLPLVNHSTATGKGAKGRGTTVVVLDTGTDYTLSDFGSCTAPGAPAACRISVAQDLAAEDNNLDDNGHGTNVAAIVSGVAPDAKVASFDVFNGATASSIDVLKGVDWAITNKVQENVVSINMSLGAGKFTVACPNDVYETPIANAKAAGIVTVVASGNNKFLNALASPACAPSAVSVGAVYSKNFGSLATATCTDASTAADKVTCFSNSASFLTMLAPGAKITAGGRTLVGTSQAAPHVAGAVALVRSPGFMPTDTATVIIDRLKSTGRTTRDARNNISKPRLDLGALIPTPAAVPSISLVVNNGATFTGSTTVQALVSAVDANQNSNISDICVSADAASCSNFVPFVAGSAIDVAISAGDGEKTLFAFARSPAGNTSTTPASDAIIFDGTAPSDGNHSQEAIVDGVALSWSGFADSASGVDAYRIYQSNSGPVSTCSGVLAYQGSDTQTNLSIPSDVGTTFYRICAVDQVGNVSSGVAGSLTRPEPPAFALSIGETVSNGSIISARLIQPINGDQQDAIPLSGDVTACVGLDNACNTFVSIPADGVFNVDLGNVEGEKTVVAQVRTSLGYRSGFASSIVLLDKTAPIDGQAHIESIPGDIGNMLVYWEGFTDALSGVQNYTVVASDNHIPESCTDGAIVYSGSNTEFLQPLVEGQQFYGYRICAIDGAYNVSEGVGVGKDRRLLPAASLVLNPAEEDPWTTDPVVIGQIVLEDPAQEILLDAMCIGFVDDGTDCTEFEPYVDSFAVDVDDGVDGEKSIFVWLRSIDGVVSRVPLHDTVILDRTAPNDGNADGEAGIKKVTLHWDNFSDEHTAIATYYVVASIEAEPISCDVGAGIRLAYNGEEAEFVDTDLEPEVEQFYRICAVDVVGNISEGATFAATPEDVPGPKGTVAIFGNPSFTNKTALKLLLSATSNVAAIKQMCISETDTCTRFSTFKTTANFSLKRGNGLKTVRVWYKDRANNVSFEPATVSVFLDATAPINGAMTGTLSEDSSKISLEWKNFSDVDTEIVAYRVMFSNRSAPRNCTTGTPLYAGTDLSFEHTTLTANKKHFYRVCAVDKAGNVSTGASVIVQVPAATPPAR